MLKIAGNKTLSSYSSILKYFSNSKYNYNFKNLKKFKKFNTILVIGMGGSILGSKAIYSFLKHRIKKKFIFVDNIDHQFLKEIKKKNSLYKTLFLIISKSGNTIETIVNSSFFTPFLNKSNTIILSENKNNILSNLARSKKFEFIKHDSSVGGRYSVFTEVGMVPAYFMGLNSQKFKKNLEKFLYSKKTISSSLKNFSRIKIKKSKILVMLNYCPELNDFLFWAQQLLAESLGKDKRGFMPVVSNAPKDHHSLMQLYLDGPKDKIFYIFSEPLRNSPFIKSKFFGNKVNYLNNKTHQNVKFSQKNALIRVFKEKKIPFREIKFKKFDEQSIGKLFGIFILETMILGKIFGVNPYDQPAVENVKIITKKLLNSK